MISPGRGPLKFHQAIFTSSPRLFVWLIFGKSHKTGNIYWEEMVEKHIQYFIACFLLYETCYPSHYIKDEKQRFIGARPLILKKRFFFLVEKNFIFNLSTLKNHIAHSIVETDSCLILPHPSVKKN